MNHADGNAASGVTAMLLALLGLSGIVDVICSNGSLDGGGHVIGIGVGVLLLLFAAADAATSASTSVRSVNRDTRIAGLRASWTGKLAVFATALFVFAVLFLAVGFVPAVFAAACLIRASVAPTTATQVVVVGAVVGSLAALLFRILPGSRIPLLGFGV